MMHARKHVKLMFTAVFVALAYSFVLSGWPATPGTLGTRIVDIDRQYRLDAVTITKVTIAGQQIQPGISGMREEERGTPFQADEDWLKNMSISLLNRTDKAIVCAQVQFSFPDTGDGSPAQPITTYTITVGQQPESSLHYADGSRIPPDPTKQPLLLAPGQTLVIPVADSIDAIQSRIEEKMLFSKITRVNIRRYMLYFVDGMRWDSSGYQVPDSDHPGHYTRLSPTYFPGHLVQN